MAQSSSVVRTWRCVEKNCEKGKEIALQGKLVNRRYKDKEGKTCYIIEIVANDIMLLGSKWLSFTAFSSPVFFSIWIEKSGLYLFISIV